MGAPRTFDRIVLDSGTGNDYARGYRVEVSNDGADVDDPRERVRHRPDDRHSAARHHRPLPADRADRHGGELVVDPRARRVRPRRADQPGPDSARHVDRRRAVGNDRRRVCDVRVLLERARVDVRLLARRRAVRRLHFAPPSAGPRQRRAPLRGARDRPGRQRGRLAREPHLDDRRRGGGLRRTRRPSPRSPTPGSTRPRRRTTRAATRCSRSCPRAP